MIKKEIWIRISNVEEADMVRAFIWGLVDRFPGDCTVNIYNNESKSIKTLPRSHRLSSDCEPALIAKFGENNIKVEIKKIAPRNEYERKIETFDFTERIADALEGINNQLERLNENIESITGTFQNLTFLNVVASVHEE